MHQPCFVITCIPLIHRILAIKRRAKFEGSGKRRINLKVKTDPLPYTFTEVAHQNMPLKGPEHTPPYPEKPSEYQVMGPHDQPSPCETMQSDDQPIYEETF